MLIYYCTFCSVSNWEIFLWLSKTDFIAVTCPYKHFLLAVFCFCVRVARTQLASSLVNFYYLTYLCVLFSVYPSLNNGILAHSFSFIYPKSLADS